MPCLTDSNAISTDATLEDGSQISSSKQLHFYDDSFSFCMVNMEMLSPKRLPQHGDVKPLTPPSTWRC